MEYGCGQCRPCRVNRSRLWVGRMILEAGEHESSLFVTLTYNDENLPKNWCVDKKVVQCFIKRLRFSIGMDKVRYYCAAEYGFKTTRPHYHFILFGLGVHQVDKILSAWPYGFAHVGVGQPDSFGYVAGYVTKSMVGFYDERLAMRVPEFSLMSRKPGLGFKAVERFKRQYETDPGKLFLKVKGMFGTEFRANGKIYPLGRYLRSCLIAALGVPDFVVEQYNEVRAKEVMKGRVGRSVYEYETARAGKLAAQDGKLSIMRIKKL